MIDKMTKEYQMTRLRFVISSFLNNGKGRILLVSGKTELFRETFLDLEDTLVENIRLFFLKEYFHEIVKYIKNKQPLDTLMNEVDGLILDGLWEINGTETTFDYHHSLLEVFTQLTCHKDEKKFILVQEGEVSEIDWMLKRYLPDEDVLIRIEIR